jgi:hypothetical protein
MEFENQGIKCSIFLDTEAVIRKTMDKVNDAQNIKEKQYYAQDILLEAETLLSCPSYKTENPDCLNCNSILRGYIKKYKHLDRDKMRVR